MLQGKYKVISVGELTGDEIEIGEVLELNNGIFVFKDGYKTKKTYKTVKEFEEIWEIKIQKIETIKIKNRDFSVLKGLRSINRWGYKTEILQAEYAIVIVVDEDMKNHITLGTDKSDECIKEMIMLQGFEIEFEDVKNVNTFKEFDLFLSLQDLCFRGTGFSNPFIDREGNLFSIIQIEEEYNVKLNILKDK